MKEKSRVGVLDVLRVIAVVMVILSHYYNNYPEIGQKVAWGALGVQLFFIISGFVIYASLENTPDYKTFIKKRFLRLSPAMLLCSTITFTFFAFFYTGQGYDHSKNFINYILANIFIDPNFVNIFFGYTKFYYIDNAYWSLWVEVTFYALIGLLFFINRQKFILYYTIICLIGVPIFYLFYSSTGQNFLQSQFGITADQAHSYKLIARGFPLFHSAFWFLKGIFLYQLYHHKEKFQYLIYILICFGINLFLERFSLSIVIFSALTFLFMLLFVYFPDKIKWLNQPFLCKIGVASYSMYLIHYHLGMVAVKYLNENVSQNYFWPFLIMFLVIFFGLFSYQYLEKPLGKVYKNIF